MRSSLVAVALASMSSACVVSSPEPASPGAPAATDACARPDVSRELDAAAPVTSRIDGCFEPTGAGDRDAYVLGVTGDRTQLVTFEVTGAGPSSQQTWVEVIARRAGRPDLALPLAQCMARPTTEPTCHVWVVAEPGTVLHVAVDDGLHLREPGTYAVAITQAPAPDHGEPNDSAEAATAIASGVPVDASLLDRVGPERDASDRDFYGITATRDGALRVVVDHVDMDARVTVLDAAGAVVATLDAPSSDAPIDATVEVRAGAYVVEVGQQHFEGELPAGSDGPGGRRPGHPYTLTVTAP